MRDGRPVIPVVLPGAPTLPELPLFLSNRTWVTCASSSTARASRVWSGASPAARPHQGLAPPRRLLRWLNWLNLLRADGPAGQERLVWRCPAVVRAGLRVLS